MDVVGTKAMSYGEAFRHVQSLAVDPSSHFAASLGGWERPTTREELVLMDLLDLTSLVAWAQSGGKGSRPKPYPRPWPSDTKRRTKPTVSQEEVIAALQRAGHTKPLPMRGATNA